jgi:dihydroflavonol-4-reductase
MSGELVLVTGGTGFVGTYCILALLDGGYRVRTTVRSAGREQAVREVVAAGGGSADGLEFAHADLLNDDGWADAVAGCAYVLHVASPFPMAAPKTDDEVVRPAREGTLRVLRAARDAGVRRVVVTSSFAAIGYGHPERERTFTEADWTDPAAPEVSPYVKSKALAERAAWDFMEREGGDMELAVVNPVGIFGPALGRDLSTSIQIVRRLMDGDVPGIPRLPTNVVDVRDVADLHVKAMTAPEAAGERFLAVAGEPTDMAEIGKLLKARLGPDARKVPGLVLPGWAVRLAALFDSSLKQVTPELGKVKRASNEKARRVLGWSPRSNEEAILASAESLVKLGLVEVAATRS